MGTLCISPPMLHSLFFGEIMLSLILTKLLMFWLLSWGSIFLINSHAAFENGDDWYSLFFLLFGVGHYLGFILMI